MTKLGTAVPTAAVIVCLMSAAAAEPARPDMAFQLAEARRGAPKTLTAFRLAGANLSIVAIGRSAAVDTDRCRDDLREARAMAKFMPGYPQPAHVTFDLKLSF